MGVIEELAFLIITWQVFRTSSSLNSTDSTPGERGDGRLAAPGDKGDGRNRCVDWGWEGDSNVELFIKMVIYTMF